MLDEVDVYVCPSREDTMPVTVVEAMCNKIPCIVSSGAGNHEYIEDGINGFVFENENASKLTDKIRWCIQNRDKLENIGEESRLIYERYFTLEVFERNLMKLMAYFD